MIIDSGLNITQWTLAIATAILLIGCGGGSGGDDGSTDDQAGDDGHLVVNTGVFINSAVEGLRFATASQNGTTDAAGTFQYAAGETVQFFVGDIFLGQAQGAQVITPIDLVSGANNELNPTVTNIARFLQTVDNDGQWGNGIQISPVSSAIAVGQSVNFAQSISGFENDGSVQILVSELTAATSAGPRMLVPASSAQSRLNASVLGLMEGMWTGTLVYEAITAPHTGDRCEWHIQGEVSDNGIFIFTSELRRATGIGAGFCISSAGRGQWQRLGNQVEFTITTSTEYLIGNITRHTGELSNNGQQISVVGRGFEQGVEFQTSITLSKRP